MPDWLRIVLLGIVLVALILVIVVPGLPLWLRLVLVLLLALSAYLFGPVGARLIKPLSERAAWEAAPRWLTCIDCTSVELGALTTQAGLTPDATIRYLADALLHGPGAAKTADLRRTLESQYVRDSTYLAQHDPARRLAPRAEYVEDFLGRFDRTWRVRAALGLGRIAVLYIPPTSMIGADAAAVLGIADTAVADSAVHRAVQLARDTAYIRDSLPR
jgi:hypothetical protein